MLNLFKKDNMAEWFYTSNLTYLFGRVLYTLMKIIVLSVIVAVGGAIIGIVGAAIVWFVSIIVKNIRIILLTICALTSVISLVIGIITVNGNKNVSNNALTVFIVAFFVGYVLTKIF